MYEVFASHSQTGLGAVTAELYATGTLDDLVPAARAKVDALIAEATKRGMKPHVRSVGRTCAQQNEQLKLGYSQAAMCRSMHVLGHAVDLDLSPNACATYTALGQWWEAQGGVWGGRWKGEAFGACGDAGHYHWGFDKAQAVPTSICPSNISLAECRALREQYISEAKKAGSSSERSYNLLALATLGVVAVVAGLAYVRR